MLYEKPINSLNFNTIDNKIEQNKAQYNLDRKTAKAQYKVFKD